MTLPGSFLHSALEKIDSPDVIGIGIVGSYAHGQESKYSDVDVDIYVSKMSENKYDRYSLRYWEDLLAGLAGEGPLGILVEDVHQADAGDLSLLTEMARRLKDARVLLVIALRPGPAAEALSDLAAQETTLAVDLGPLDADAVARLLQERAQGARLVAEVLRRVLDVAEGNPLLTIEVFRHLEETGALATEGSVVVPGPAWGRAALPRRVRDLVPLRLRELSEDERAILDVAAVDGVEFEGEAVASALERPTLDVLRSLQQIHLLPALSAPVQRAETARRRRPGRSTRIRGQCARPDPS